MKYSKITGCFYPDNINYTDPPSDLVDVSKSDYEAAILRNSDQILDVVDGGLVIIQRPAPPLEDLKQVKIDEIADAFYNEIKSGFTTSGGIKMNADITDVQRLKSAYDLAGLFNQTTLPIMVDYDNTVQTSVPMADVLELIKELGVHYQTLYAKKQTLRSQAMAAQSEQELNAIIWS